MQQLVLGEVVDGLAACPSGESGDVLFVGLSNFVGAYWTGALSLLHASDGRLVASASAELRHGVPAVAALPEKDPYTGRLLLAAAGDDGSVSLWESSAAAGAPELRQAQAKVLHDDIVSGLAVGSSNAQLASASWDGTLRLWDCTQLLAPAGQLVGHRGAVHAVAWEPSGSGSMVVSAGQDGTIKAWDTRLPSSAACSLAVGAPAFSLALPPQQPNLILVGDQWGRLSAFDWRAAATSGGSGGGSQGVGASAGRQLLCAKVHEDAVRSMACRPGGGGGSGGEGVLDVAAGGDDGRVVLFSSAEAAAGAVTTAKAVSQAQGPPPAYIRALAWGTGGLYRGGWDTIVEQVAL